MHTHDDHAHTHGPDCGHTAVKHGDHLCIAPRARATENTDARARTNIEWQHCSAHLRM